MEWVRKNKMSPGLRFPISAASSQQRQITYEELKEHNTETDCWMALRGQVFDVTGYVKFHLGGVSEIMKGAGKDATTVFNTIHRYVNLESILKGRRVGMYAGESGTSTSDPGHTVLQMSEVGDKTLLPRKCCGCCCRCCCRCCCCKCCDQCKVIIFENDEVLPFTRFREDETEVCFEVELRGYKYKENYWTVGILGKKDELMIKVVTKPPQIWIAHFKLREALPNEAIDVSFPARAKKMVVKLQKPSTLLWKSIGEPLHNYNVHQDSRQSMDDMYRACILSKTQVAHNTFLFAIQTSAHIGTPPGFDLKITLGELSRRYTPITLLFPSEPGAAEPTSPNCHVLYFLIKLYPGGIFTPLLFEVPLQVEGSLLVGGPRGNFDTEFLVGAEAFFLLASGSGITPQFQILKYFLDHNWMIGATKVALVHWCKEEQDLVWKSSFDKLSKEKPWFKYLPHLTQCPADDPWPGDRSRICVDIMKNILNKCRVPEGNRKRLRFIICGSNDFNYTVCELLESMCYYKESVFIFLP